MERRAVIYSHNEVSEEKRAAIEAVFAARPRANLMVCDEHVPFAGPKVVPELLRNSEFVVTNARREGGDIERERERERETEGVGDKEKEKHYMIEDFPFVLQCSLFSVTSELAKLRLVLINNDCVSSDSSQVVVGGRRSGAR